MNQKAIAVLVSVSMIGGILGIVAEVLSLPIVIVIVGTGLFGVGVIGAAIAAFVASRKTGVGFGKSLVAGVRFAGRWIWELAP